MLGRHNVMNGLAALAAANAVGVDLAAALPALADFVSVEAAPANTWAKRAASACTTTSRIIPTAIRDHARRTARARRRARASWSAMEPRSNSMRLGAHSEQIAPSLDEADLTVFLQRPELAWDAGKVVAALTHPGEAVVERRCAAGALRELARPGDHVVFMSNGGFEGAPRRALAVLAE